MSIRNELLEDILTATGSGVSEAPIDGSPYARQDAGWVSVSPAEIAGTLGILTYKWLTDTAATNPTQGFVKGNNSDLSLITELYINDLSPSGSDISDTLAKMDIGDQMFISDFLDAINNMSIEVTAKPIDNTGWYTIPVQINQSSGTIDNLEGISINILATSNRAKTISIERLFDGVSVSASQQPTGTGEANKIQINFGPAIGTGSDDVQLLANGTVKVNTAGTYRIKIALQFGRTGSAGTSVLLFRVADSLNNQLGRTVSAIIDDPDTLVPYENDTWLTVPAAMDFKFEVMRDLSGNNSGGIFSVTPTVEGGSEWANAPAAAIRVERWISGS